MIKPSVELEADAAGQEREAELVEADALTCGLIGELLVEGDGESQDELSASFHAADSTACGIDITSTARDTDGMSDLIGTVITAARALEKNEALFLPTECVIARSNTGKLRFGDGNQRPTWRVGDGEDLLREHLTAMLDRSQTGYFALRYRDELRIPSTLRPAKVAAVGRRSFHVEYEATDRAITALMLLQDCEWFEYEGHPYGAAEAWTAEGRHLWVTPTGEIRDMDRAVAA